MTAERSLYAPIVNGARDEGWVLTRIPDGSIGKNCFDIIGACAMGYGVGMEVKVAPEPVAASQRLPKKLFREHQITYLNMFAELLHAWALPVLYAASDHTLYVYELADPESWKRPSGDLLIGRLTRQGGVFTGWEALAGHSVKVDVRYPAR